MTLKDEENFVWDKIFNEKEWGKYPSEDLIRFIAKYFYNSSNDRKNIKILEIGSGPGANLWFLAREGFCVYGIDLSKKAIEISKERLELEVSGWKGSLFCGDISNLNFEDDFFDAVIDIEAGSCNDFVTAKKYMMKLIEY